MTNRILAAALLCLGASLLVPTACDNGVLVEGSLTPGWIDTRSPCPGRCMRHVEDYVWSYPLLVWTGRTQELPSCEQLGLIHVVEGGTRPRADLACPECACEALSCTDGLGLHGTGAPECEPMMRSWHTKAAGEGECMRYSTFRGPGYHAWQIEYPHGLCRPFRRTREIRHPAELWEESFLACRPRGAMAYRCDAPLDGYCVHPYEEPRKRGFQVCVRYQDISAMDDDPMWENTSCPPEYPEKLIGHLGVEDGCGECTCELREGATCSFEVSVYGDSKCTELLGSKVVSLDDPCLTLPAPSAAGGVVVRKRDAGPVACEPRDVGPRRTSPTPVRREMFCCQPRGT